MFIIIHIIINNKSDYIQVFSYTWHILLLKSLSRSIVQLAYLVKL